MQKLFKFSLNGSPDLIKFKIICIVNYPQMKWEIKDTQVRFHNPNMHKDALLKKLEYQFYLVSRNAEVSLEGYK